MYIFAFYVKQVHVPFADTPNKHCKKFLIFSMASANLAL